MLKSDEIIMAIENSFISVNELDSNLEPANVVDGLFAIARALNRCANAIDKLGLNDASTPMGAIELLSLEVKDGLRNLSDAVGYLKE